MAAHVASKVSSAGALSLYVAESFRTAEAVAVTVSMPAGALSSLYHGGNAPLLVTAPPAASLDIKASGSGPLHVAAAPVASGGSFAVTLVGAPLAPLLFAILAVLCSRARAQSGMADVLLCASAPTALRTLDATLSGTASLHVDDYAADELAATLSGMGDLTLSGAPAGSARLALSGSGKLSAAARTCDVALTGMGDVFVSDADAVSGSISGMGNVHYAPATATCRTSGFGMGSCSPGEAPPPRLRCTDHGGKELDQGNARGFVVDVSGSQCQVHTP